MNKRILANLAFFALITALLLVWAVNNVVSFDFLKHPYKVTASFDTSPGLFTGSQVTYLGHPIGTVGAVKLLDKSVLVTLKIDNGVKVPDALSAAVLRQSAVGEPYVELEPLAGTNATTAKLLAGGDHIPVEHTTVPLAYSDLFKAIDNLIAAVSPTDVHTLVHELALGLDGRSDSIRQLLTGADQLTTSFAARSDELDAALTAFTQLTHTLAGQSGALATSTDNVAALAATLRQSAQTIATLLDTGPGFAGSVAAILDQSKGDLGCFMDALGGVSARLNDPQLAAKLGETISLGNTIIAIIKDVTDIQPDGPYQKGNFLFNLGNGPPVVFYPTPLKPPTVPPLPSCAASTLTVGAGPASATGGAVTPVGPSGPNGVPNATGPVHPGGGPAGPSSVKPANSGGLSPLMKTAFLVLLAILVLLAVIGAVRRWLWLPLQRRRGDQPAASGLPAEVSGTAPLAAVGAAASTSEAAAREDGADGD